MRIDWFADRARISGSKVAVIEAEKGREWTFEQMNQRAINLAAYLQEKGIQSGDRVALFSSNDVAHFDFLFACTKIGAIFVPMNWRLKDTEVLHVVENSQPKLLAYSRVHKTRLGLISEEILDVDIDSEEYDAIVDPRINKTFQPNQSVTDEDIAVLIYTSGTTGLPKGAMISHRAIISNGLNSIPSWNIHSNDRGMTTTPMFHTAGLFCFTVPILMSGGQMVVQRFFDADDTIKIIRDFKPTKAFFVPTMCYMLAHSTLFNKENLSSLDYIISGGAPLSENVYQLFANHDLPLVNSYGLTEIGPNNFANTPERQKIKKLSVGRPIMFNNVRLVDDEGNDVPQGEVGNLIISNNAKFSGYWNNTEETAKVLKYDFVFTGDLARMDEEGDYFIVGRSKDMIITGGENVYPSEVEKVLNQFPGVVDSVVFGIPVEQWGESVVAAIITKGLDETVIEALSLYAKDNLAGYKTPKRYYLLDEFPKTPIGKIDKKALLQMAQEYEEGRQDFSRPKQIIM